MPYNKDVMDYPKYTLHKLDDGDNWLLTPKHGFQRILTHGNLTGHVWHVTQEFHCHDFWEICLVLRGNSVQRFLDREEPMKQGSVYILRPQDVHCIKPNKLERHENMQSAPYVHCDIYVPIEKMKRICAAIDEQLYNRLLTRAHPLSTCLPVNEINHLESTINFYGNLNENFDGMHSVIVSHILCSVIENQRTVQSTYPAWLSQLLISLDCEDFMIKSTREIIDTAGYNQSYLCRQFKRYTNQTLVEYIHKRKCSYSIHFLSDPNISISQITQRLHFTDESTYIRIFKQIYGMTPGQWRKRLSYNPTTEN